VKKVSVYLLPMLMLCACSSVYTSNVDKAYLNSQNGKHLKVPAPLNGSELSHFYDLPKGKKTTVANVEPPTHHA